MKKLMTVFLSSILLLCLIACDTSPSPETSDADTSSAISTDSDAGTEAPGTLTNVDKLPTADASEVGKKISVSLAPNGETNEIGFVFRRNAETGRERLVTIENTAGSQSVMLLSVYETSFGSVKALCEALEAGVCDAVLTARIYIDWIEGKYTTNSFYGLIRDADSFVQNSDEANGQSFFGLICRPVDVSDAKAPALTSDGERVVYLYEPNESDAQSQSHEAVWQRIYDRFDEKYGLNALVSVD